MAVKEDVDSDISGSGLPVDGVNVTFEAVFEEFSFWPLLPLFTVGDVMLEI